MIKKLIPVLFAACLCSTACGNTDVPETQPETYPASMGIELATPSSFTYDAEDVSAFNPWKTFDDAGEASRTAGFVLRLKDSEGADVSYHVLPGSMIEASYMFEDMDIAIRKGWGSLDISGDYNVYEETVPIVHNGINVALRKNGGVIHGMAWVNGEFSYSVYSSKGIDDAYAETLLDDII